MQASSCVLFAPLLCVCMCVAHPALSQRHIDLKLFKKRDNHVNWPLCFYGVLTSNPTVWLVPQLERRRSQMSHTQQNN